MKYEEPPELELNQLRAQLSEWRAPDLPAALDARVLASFRQQVTPRSKWNWLRLPMPVPWPVAATMICLLCAASWFVARRTVTPPIIAAPLTAATRFVEVPVVQEKIVTRVVYVTAPAVAKPKETALPNSGKRPTRWPSDLAGFHPVSEIKLEINAGGLER
jgi:hypothetical protein